MPVDPGLTCVYCGGHAEGNFMIHRDGFGRGPEVDLCNACGCESTPSLFDIWTKIARAESQGGADE